MAMPHLDSEAIELLLSGELGEPDLRARGAHLAECPACARRVEAARQQDRAIGELLSSLDHPVPRVAAEDVVRRAGRGWRHRYAVAASIVLLAAAGAAVAAVPGSPVRAWLAGLLEGPPRAPVEEPPEAPLPQGQPAGIAAGISLVPTERFELVFASGQESGVLRITLSDEAELAVRASGTPPAYSVGPEQVRVENAGATADYEILIPRSASSVRIRVGDTVVFTKQGAAVTAAAAPDAEGRYFLEFAHLRPAGGPPFEQEDVRPPQ
jgi:hypothetical protein